MNVCLRGSSSGSMALWKRCAGNRRALSHSYKAGEVGFRLNGVLRGGRWISMSPMLHRCGYRVSRPKTDVDGQYMGISTVGFRLGCEWCTEGRSI